MKELYKDKPTSKKTKAVESRPEGQAKKSQSQAYRHLVKPLITEKAANLSAKNKYFFQVSGASNKIEVAKAIESVYGVKPKSVNILNVSGKKVRYGRLTGRRKDWKKAVITLPEGKSINIYEGV